MKLEPVTLVNLAAVRCGGGAPQDSTAFGTLGFPFIRAGSLPKLLDGVSEDSLEKIEPRVADQYRLRLFPAGTILFAKSGMSATKGDVYRLRGPAYVVNHLAALVPYELEDAAFLERALQRFSPTALIRDPAYPSIRLGEIENMKVLAPQELKDRRRIAEILEKVDALRSKRRAGLAKLDTLTQSIYLEMFGDPTTNPKGWPMAALRGLGRVTTGRTPPSAKKGMFNGAIPFITPGDLESDQPIKRTVTNAGAEASRTVDAGATLVCCIGTIGKIGRSTVRSAFNQQINAVEWGLSIHAEYGFSVMRFFKPKIVSWGSSTTLPILKKSSFEQIKIPVPPLTVQREFALQVERVERARATHLVALSKSNELFNSVQQVAFRGDL